MYVDVYVLACGMWRYTVVMKVLDDSSNSPLPSALSLESFERLHQSIPNHIILAAKQLLFSDPTPHLSQQLISLLGLYVQRQGFGVLIQTLTQLLGFLLEPLRFSLLLRGQFFNFSVHVIRMMSYF